MKKFLFVSLLILIIGFPLAYGHPFLEETNPPRSSTVPAGVTKVITHYSEAVELNFSVIKVLDASGNQIDNKDVQYYEGEDSLIVTTPPLEDGIYTVTSKVLSKVDGHLVDYAFVIGVGDVEIGDIPGQTCPLIDKVIKQVNNIFGIIKNGPRYGDSIDALGDIESELWDTEDTLEIIRGHNDQLRQLGKYWYDQYVATEENSQKLEEHLQYCQQMCQQEVSPSSHPWYS